MRFLLALTVFLATLAVPALAADSTVDVGDDFFDPSTSSADPGDTVTWNWSGSNDHTVTSGKRGRRSRQIDTFRSRIETTGASFRHTFKYAGAFSYFCERHPDSMRATVTVGTDDGVKPKVTSVKAGATKVRFKVSERSVVTVKVTGRRKIVKTFGSGKHSVRFKRLTAGRHKASVSAKDGFGHTGKKSKRFRTR